MLRYSPDDCRQLLSPEAGDRGAELLKGIGFADCSSAVGRLRNLGRDAREREQLAALLPAVLLGLQSAHAPDQSLLNFERLVDIVPDRSELFRQLAASPRQVEILLRLFVSSQFLSEILLRNPEYLPRLTRHQRLAEIKLPPQYQSEAESAVDEATGLTDKHNGLRRFQQWELLRLAACDTFHLVDLRTVTQQLSWLADALIQTCLQLVAADLNVSCEPLAVIAFGKLGGEELNYSSDVDLIFVAKREAEKYWKLGQRLISALNDPTELGFLYRVDMRLRPWGQSGPLVTTAEAYLDYLKRHARPWELQALLKARTVAGAVSFGDSILRRAAPLMREVAPEAVQSGIREQLAAQRPAGASREELEAAIKTGPGGIRDIEFLTQFLQMTSGRQERRLQVRSTLEALVQLADAEVILPGEYQHLTSAYVFQRSVEHSLQLMHNRQQYSLPKNERELEYLAGRLDYPSVEHFLAHYNEHRRCVRDIVQRRLESNAEKVEITSGISQDVARHLGSPVQEFAEVFETHDQQRVLQLLEKLGPDHIIATEVRPLPSDRWELTFAGFDELGDLSLICGQLFASGFDIETGYVFTGGDVPGSDELLPNRPRAERRRKFVNQFTVHRTYADGAAPDWELYTRNLDELLRLAAAGRLPEAQGKLARRLGAAVRRANRPAGRLQPFEIAIDNDQSERSTVMLIRGEDTPGFLYELCNALATNEVSIQRMRIQTVGAAASDTLHVTTIDGRKIVDTHRQQELRAAVVLTKHFTHLLPETANPAAALTHFRELLTDLFQQSGWLEQLASLQQPEVLSALVKMFGESDFLWEDFLRLHHGELLPLVTNIQELEEVRDGARMQRDIHQAVAAAHTPELRREALNDFKDREMFRIDMRHILGYQQEFGLFSQELTQLAEAVVQAATALCLEELSDRYGGAIGHSGNAGRFVVCALGKCGGRELGFASDIELMFIYDEEGETSGRERVSNAAFYTRLVECCTKSISARQQGIFEIDLRLRPYGSAGSLAISRAAFERYYDADGPGWPYERQALVKLRPIAGDLEFGREVVEIRDRLIYTGRPFDLNAMRGLRERQLRELVRAGEFNAKLSPGGVVDCEYFVQALQIAFGHARSELRDPNTRNALRVLEQVGIIEDRRPLRDAYRFLRRLIDALRMVRGNARDLTVPAEESDQFEFLSRRLGYGSACAQLKHDLALHTSVVRDHMQRLDELLKRSTPF